jgi:hypothetical protein
MISVEEMQKEIYRAAIAIWRQGHENYSYDECANAARLIWESVAADLLKASRKEKEIKPD